MGLLPTRPGRPGRVGRHARAVRTRALSEETQARRFGARALLAFLAILVAAVPFGVLVVLVRAKFGPLHSLDLHTDDSLHTFARAHPGFVTAMKVVSALGSPLAWWIVLTPLALWLVIVQRRKRAVFVAVTALGSGLLNLTVKAVVARTRPHLPHPVAVAHGTSFPSGHTQASTVGFGLLVLVLAPWVGTRMRTWLWVCAALCVALIGFSRIALGVHYLSDVLGAVLIGAAWLLATTAAFAAWRQESRERR